MGKILLWVRKHLIFIPLILVIAILALGFGSYFFESTFSPSNIYLSNVTDHQATISWTTNQPTKGVILVSVNNNLPFLPLFASNRHKDDGEKKLSKSGLYTTHHITVGGLQPEKIYYYAIYQGLRKVYTGSFETGSTLSIILNPDPVYGQVSSSNQQQGVPGVMVYLQVLEKGERSAFISTLTNLEGRWSLDLGNLRTESLKESFKMSSSSAELVLVEGGSLGRFRAEAKVGQDKPWPDIILKERSK